MRLLSTARLKAASLTANSHRRTHVRRTVDYNARLRQMRLQPTAGFKRKSAVYGLNGQRANCVIALSLVTYERTIRNHAVLPHFSQGPLHSQHEIKLFRLYEL